MSVPRRASLQDDFGRVGEAQARRPQLAKHTKTYAQTIATLLLLLRHSSLMLLNLQAGVAQARALQRALQHREHEVPPAVVGA